MIKILIIILLILFSNILYSPNKIRSKAIIVTATVYQGVSDQTDDTPNITSIMAEFNPSNPPKWIAVSRDLLRLFPYGSTVEIKGAGKHSGYFKVMDTMNKRKTNQIDILIPDYIEPGHSLYGKWNNVHIIKK